MAKLVLKIAEKELTELKEIWKFNQHNITKEVLDQVGWHSIEDFAYELMVYGFSKASEDPVGFVRAVREAKNPIFRQKKQAKEVAGRKFEEEFKKAYV